MPTGRYKLVAILPDLPPRFISEPLPWIREQRRWLVRHIADGSSGVFGGVSRRRPHLDALRDLWWVKRHYAASRTQPSTAVFIRGWAARARHHTRRSETSGSSSAFTIFPEFASMKMTAASSSKLRCVRQVAAISFWCALSTSNPLIFIGTPFWTTLYIAVYICGKSQFHVCRRISRAHIIFTKHMIQRYLV